MQEDLLINQALLDDLSDERPEAFAALKKLLKGPPAAKQWRRLCEELKRWEDCPSQTFEALLGYIKEAISPWHRHFELTMPAPWLARLQRDEPCPQLVLIESLELPAVWAVSSYTQNARYLSSLKSLRHEQVTTLNESSLVTMLQQVKLPQLKQLKLSCWPRAVDEQELELLSVLASLELPSLEELSITRLDLCERTLKAWLSSSWSPGLKRLTLVSASVALPHLHLLFEAAQDGRLQPELHLALPAQAAEANRHLHQERAETIALNTSYVWTLEGEDPSDPYEALYLDEPPSDLYEDLYLDDGWE